MRQAFGYIIHCLFLLCDPDILIASQITQSSFHALLSAIFCCEENPCNGIVKVRPRSLAREFGDRPGPFNP